MAQYYELAPCENAAFYQKYLSSSPLVTGLIFRNLNAYPYVDQWSDTNRIVTMTYIATAGRAIVNNLDTDQTSLIYAVTMAEMIGPYLNKTLFLEQEPAGAALMAAVQAVTRPQGGYLRNMPGVSENAWRALFQPLAGPAHAAAAVVPGLDPVQPPAAPAGPLPHETVFPPALVAKIGQPQLNDWNVNNVPAALRVLYYLASASQGYLFKRPIELITHITLAISKRGTVTTGFLNKVIQGIRTDLDTDVEISPDVLNIFYNKFAAGIDDETIINVRRTWMGLIPQQALRLTLTVQQLTGSGLTAYITIIRAMRMFDDFNWAAVQRAYPTEWLNVQAAIEVVGDNLYWGFKRDIGVARSTLFKSIAWVSKELLVKGNGEAPLNRYQGWPRAVAYMNTMSTLIDAYIAARSAREVDVNNIQLGAGIPDVVDLAGALLNIPL